jgi:hypothetical protein
MSSIQTEPLKTNKITISKVDYVLEDVFAEINSLKFKALHSSYILTFLGKKERVDFSHENISEIIIVGNSKDVNFRNKSDDIFEDRGEKFIVREFIDGKIAKDYFASEVGVEDKVWQLLKLLSVLTTVLLESKQRFVVSLTDIVVANNGETKIVNLFSDSNQTSNSEVLYSVLEELKKNTEELLKETQAMLTCLEEQKDIEKVKKKMENIGLFSKSKNNSETESVLRNFLSSNQKLFVKADKILRKLKSQGSIEKIAIYLNRTKYINNRKNSVGEIDKDAIETEINQKVQRKDNELPKDILPKINFEVGKVIRSSIQSEIEVIYSIKSALAKSFAEAIDSLAKHSDLAFVWPFSKSDAWHVTILVHKLEGCGCFAPVLIKTYKGTDYFAHSDWVSRNKDQVLGSRPVSNLLAGTSISWYIETEREELQKYFDDDFNIYFIDGTTAFVNDKIANRNLKSQEKTKIKYVMFKNFKNLYENNSYVRKRYKDGDDMGWKILNEVGAQSKIEPQNMNLLISIPIYNFSQDKDKNLSEQITAVAHFEIEQSLSGDTPIKIAETLAYLIQDRNALALSRFHSDVVRSIDYESQC